MKTLLEKKSTAAGLLLLVEVIWAISYIIIHETVKKGTIPPMSLACSRFIVAWLALCLIRTPGPKPVGRDKHIIWLMGVLGFALCVGLQNFGLVHTSATNASILAGLIPAFTVLGSALFFRERFTAANFAGLAIAFIGGALIIWNGKVNFDLNPIGDLLMVLSCLAWSAYTLIGRSIYDKYSTFLISRITVFVGAVCTLPFLLYDIKTGAFSVFTIKEALVILYLGVMVTAVGFTVWVFCVRILGMVYTSNLLYFQCVITMICAHFTIHEPITVFLVACTAGVILGVFLSNLSSAKARSGG